LMCCSSVFACSCLADAPALTLTLTLAHALQKDCAFGDYHRLEDKTIHFP
jgi:hypothetical protein